MNKFIKVILEELLLMKENKQVLLQEYILV